MSSSELLELIATGESLTLGCKVTFDKTSIALSINFASEEALALPVSASNMGFISGSDASNLCNWAKSVAAE